MQKLKHFTKKIQVNDLAFKNDIDLVITLSNRAGQLITF